MDPIITVLLMPIALMLTFVSVLGGAMRLQTGSVSYMDFITPRFPFSGARHWSVWILAVSFTLALTVYRRKNVVVPA